MLLNLQNITKTIGIKTLYTGLDLTIQPGERVGLIGRNGIGKTTLLGIMAGTDHDYAGSVDSRRGLIIASTTQEHHGLADKPVLEYILENLPDYARLKHIIDTYPLEMGDDMAKISIYSDALTRFVEMGYYDAEADVRAELAIFQLPPERIDGPFGHLSGGQKRFVELVKVTLSDADLALIDEPTNHMDYVAKQIFIDWLKKSKQSVVVVTHDRDVLAHVNRIVEIKAREVLSFPGNYDAYLRQNGAATAKAIDSYENAQKRLVKLEKAIRDAKARKAGWSGTADKTNPFMLLEKRLSKERDELQDTMTKPDFWIDQETLDQQQDKVVAKYDKYKARNIRLRTGGEHRARSLFAIEDISLGYKSALFEPVNLDLAVGERLQIKGRNGLGKSTLVKALLATAAEQKIPSTVYSGSITVGLKTVIGVYEQEIAESYLNLALGSAIRRVYDDANIPITDQKVRQILADYLFDPQNDSRLDIARLSGGQKARFQLIKMLCANPNLLVLDEPTNHLDLPSIEELERALARYQGAILYISHDSYFAEAVGGDLLELTPVTATL